MAVRAARDRIGFVELIQGFAFGAAVVVSMRWFAVEIAEIPTPSMQPTLVGSSEAGVFDHVVVDKLRYRFVEPRRFDVVSFRNPLRKTETWVKRIVGLPGDVLRIAGGNLYVVDKTDAQAGDDGLRPLRRPADVQAAHWLEVFPARQGLHDGSSLLGDFFQATGGDWSGTDATLVLRNHDDTSPCTLTFVDAVDGGLVDRVHDGLPIDVARVVVRNPPYERPQAVQDLRFTVTLSPRRAPAALRVELVVRSAERAALVFALSLADGGARLLVETSEKELATSAVVPFEIAPGAPLRLRFTHLDDQCVAELNDGAIVRLDCARFRTLTTMRPAEGSGECTLRMILRGGGETRIEGLRIERDVHFRSSLESTPSDDGRSFVVPTDSYFMLGDNPSQSLDSRDWIVTTLGVDEGNRLVDPNTHPSVHRVRGALRVVSPFEPMAMDENPIVLMAERLVVFADTCGEVFTLRGGVDANPHSERAYSSDAAWFLDGTTPWLAERTAEPFVARSAIEGRVVFAFHPPLGLRLVR
ncbi:MAG: signal peptidase I [Planctomycetota bacterium]